MPTINVPFGGSESDSPGTRVPTPGLRQALWVIAVAIITLAVSFALVALI